MILIELAPLLRGLERMAAELNPDGVKRRDLSSNRQAKLTAIDALTALAQRQTAYNASPARQGEWREARERLWPGMKHDMCSVCGWENTWMFSRAEKPNFCPCCGADMRPGQSMTVWEGENAGCADR